MHSTSTTPAKDFLQVKNHQTDNPIMKKRACKILKGILLVIVSLILILGVMVFIFFFVPMNTATPIKPSLTAHLRGLNWADRRDNFVDGVLCLSGLTATDTYETANAKAAQVTDQMFGMTGANTLRLPINEATIERSFSSYTGVIDAILARGSAILAYWPPRDGKPADIGRFYRMWDAVIERYGSNPQCYFEPINEPYGYRSNDLCNFYSDFLTRYPNVARKQIILDGSGLVSLFIGPMGRDRRLDGTILTVHCYGYYAGYTGFDYFPETAWWNFLTLEIGPYADRVLVSEWGAPMDSGFDYSIPTRENYINSIRAFADRINRFHIGSVYWPGLRDYDRYSLFKRTNSKDTIALTMRSESGLAQIRHAWGIE